ncbi:malate dehydrogenase [Gracilibacillus halophilus YIM-C55.5]|uniref:Malate dehydrogenase n=1 Tax=Gracilibacillus halophilus YIM-C55.5 TaxID=1308866 RepID=N4WL94_9BACI|nr:malate dehydrogenase [Gracilibacillus halophilus YIM-C55.5]
MMLTKGVEALTNLKKEALQMHEECKGKLTIKSKVPIRNAQDLSLAYSPGVAEPCRKISTSKDTIYDYTMKSNMIGIVSNGSAVLGLGDIGANAALPVMEGKAVLFKQFADVDAFPLCLETSNTEEMIRTIQLAAPNFGGINLEDIKAPECFMIEEKLKDVIDIPVFHDDQHGTAIVTVAGLLNALKLVKKDITNVKVVLNGAGAAGIAIVKLLYHFGVREMIMCDSKGAIYKDRQHGMNELKEEVATFTNQKQQSGALEEVITDADIFIGVSVGGLLSEDMVKRMASDAIIFAMANPEPEIMPDQAKKAGAKVIGTGRSDFPNQVNNVLAFPGIFRGALDVRASDINEQMKVKAAEAIASLIKEKDVAEDYVIPNPFDERVASVVAKSVAQAAIDTDVARLKLTTSEIEKKINQRFSNL